MTVFWHFPHIVTLWFLWAVAPVSIHLQRSIKLIQALAWCSIIRWYFLSCPGSVWPSVQLLVENGSLPSMRSSTETVNAQPDPAELPSIKVIPECKQHVACEALSKHLCCSCLFSLEHFKQFLSSLFLCHKAFPSCHIGERNVEHGLWLEFIKWADISETRTATGVVRGIALTLFLYTANTVALSSASLSSAAWTGSITGWSKWVSWSEAGLFGSTQGGNPNGSTKNQQFNLSLHLPII